MEAEEFRVQLKALGDPTRYKIVQYLLKREHCPRSLASELGISESAISQHMTVLRKAGLVSSYRHSYHIHFVLEKGKFQRLVDELQSWVDVMGQAKGCHGGDSCQFRIDGGEAGCLYETEDDGADHGDEDVAK